MVNLFSVIIVCIFLAASLFAEIYILFRSQSHKKNYFLLMQAMIITYLVGYLLELTSTTTDESFIAVKVLYIGGLFVTTFAFFFIADYCNIKLHPIFIKSPMILICFFMIAIMWTTNYHHLVYVDYYYDSVITNRLEFTPGPLYTFLHLYPIFLVVLAILILVNQLRIWKNKYRKQLLLLILCMSIPFLSEGIYVIMVLAGFDSHLYLTPYSMSLMSFFICLWVMRFNIFEIISIATLTAIEHIKEGFVLVDKNNNYLSSNAATGKILPGILKLNKGESIFSAADWPEELKNDKRSTIDFSINNGSTRHYAASISPVLAPNKNVIGKIFLFWEITDTVKLMKELENAAYIDSLTQIYNRKHFIELANVEIERAIRMNQSTFTAMLDLDFFKKVNDTYGHAAGDMVLKATAGIIRQTIRSYDLLCRYGGEEFVLLLTALDTSEAKRLVERIRENMEHSILFYEGTEIRVTCSIGLAEFLKTDTLETAIKKADEALYSAKNSGRNCVKVYGNS